ncbi:hypothetical protein EA71_01515 [Enterococcus durans]|uniref:Uncharacterized protein n=1 Tax=Enterococcus durans TaxID=53345 RepID=A0A367CEH0_9ENTE|nr:hypothetical protein EA71_01515 [Enterococcus durans]
MQYIVVIEKLDGERVQKEFSNYREALCCATDYRRVKQSKILKEKTIVNEFYY